MLPTARIKALVAHSPGTDVTDGYVGGLADDPAADAQRVRGKDAIDYYLLFKGYN